jgi:hypothetical protein
MEGDAEVQTQEDVALAKAWLGAASQLARDGASFTSPPCGVANPLIASLVAAPVHTRQIRTRSSHILHRE